jgi:hypothetical protein
MRHKQAQIMSHPSQAAKGGDLLTGHLAALQVPPNQMRVILIARYQQHLQVTLCCRL